MMRTIKIISGLAISVALLALALRGVDPRAAWASLRQAQPLPLLGAAAAFLAAYVARGLRWRIMLHRLAPPPRFRFLLSATFIGAAANNILPLRAGELVRSFALSRTSSVSVATSLSSIVLERVLDGLTLLALLLPLLFALDLPTWVARVGAVAAVLFLAAALFLAAVFHGQERVEHWAERILQRLKIRRAQRIVEIIGRLQNGLKLLASGGDVAFACAASLLIWLLEAASYWLTATALAVPLEPAAVLLCLVIVNLGLTLPSSPGFVGTFEYACILALGAFAITPSTAIGFAVVLHALFWTALVAGGLTFAWIDHGGWRKLTINLKATIPSASPVEEPR